jgi:hypothetical protein
VWSAHYERKDIFGIAAARPLGLQLEEGAVRRARWFSGLIVEPNGFSEQGSRIHSLGLNAGVLLESRSFGIVQFQLSYSRKLSP